MDVCILQTLFRRCLSKVWNSFAYFPTVWYVWSAIIRSDLTSLWHCVHVHSMCAVSMSKRAHWLRTSRYKREKFNFSSTLFTHAHTHTGSAEKKYAVKKTHVMFAYSFFPYFSSYSTSDHVFLWHITSNRLNAYLSLRWYFFLYFYGCTHTPHPHALSLSLSHSVCMFRFPRVPNVYMEKLVRIWNNFYIIEHIFLFIPILPWICHINSPHMPDTWLHLLMSDRGVMCANTRQSIRM